MVEPGEAGDERGGGDAGLLVAGLELGERVEGRRVDAAGAQEVEQTLAPTVALGQQQHALRGVADVALQARERVFGAAHHREVWQSVELHKRRSG
ncbi:hypothetical protein FQZ97_1017190 [compost metagenome]